VRRRDNGEVWNDGVLVNYAVWFLFYPALRKITVTQSLLQVLPQRHTDNTVMPLRCTGGDYCSAERQKKKTNVCSNVSKIFLSLTLSPVYYMFSVIRKFPL
jgi:hypothetical protein